MRAGACVPDIPFLGCAERTSELRDGSGYGPEYSLILSAEIDAEEAAERDCSALTTFTGRRSGPLP